MTTYPWLKFYPSDWRGDPLLRRCSLPARGLWIELIGLMHGSAEYGHLDPTLTEQDIAQIVGAPLKNVRRALAELERNRVFDRGEKGEIVSRRMVRDHAKAVRDQRNGSKGGNPSLMPGVNPEIKAQIPDARIQKDQIPESTAHRHHHDDGVDDGTAKKLSIGSPFSISNTASRGTSPTSISDTAFKLSNIISALCGYSGDRVPRSWSGAPERVQSWLDRGWPAELIQEACRQQIVKRRGEAPSSIAYFERGIAELVAWWATASVPALRQTANTRPDADRSQGARNCRENPPAHQPCRTSC
ncbi:MAG: hypothetical protein K2Y27_31490 [Xanthobacteraceae bacterium]|nr:hypothetical protein [Xanthobacteraceae bacterium]